MAKKVKTKSIMEEFDWDHVFKTFSFRNRVVYYSLLGITFIVLSMVLTLVQENYYFIKVGGFIGVLLMVYALMISVHHTKHTHHIMRKAYAASDIIYGIFILVYLYLIVIM